MAHPLLSETLALLSSLVAHNTDPTRSNQALVTEVETYLRECGLTAITAPDESGEKISLLCRIGPETDGGIVLSGHTDVVSVEGQHWQTPPFALNERDGCYYARGACDMKGFIACVLAQAPHFAAAKLNKPVYIALSRDEEIGSVGMPQMLDMVGQSGTAPAAAIVGEPTQMKIVAGHKAGYEMLTIFTGAEAHSSMPAAGSSANVPAARFIVFLEELSEAMTKQPVADSLFNPPYGTINIGIVRGGTAKNIIAGKCVVDWHYRSLPHEDPEVIIEKARRYAAEVLLPQMRAGGHQAAIEVVTESSYPGLTPDENSPALQLARQLTGEADYQVVSFGADSGHWQRGGIPAVLVGPGSIEQAHKPDEFITADQLSRCLVFLDNLREYLETCGNPSS